METTRAWVTLSITALLALLGVVPQFMPRPSSINTSTLSVSVTANGVAGVPPASALAEISALLSFDIVNTESIPIDVVIAFDGTGALSGSVANLATEFAAAAFGLDVRGGRGGHSLWHWPIAIRASPTPLVSVSRRISPSSLRSPHREPSPSS